MMRVALNILKDNYLAEDAVHDSFIKIATHMDKIEDVNSTKTKRYLIVITKNVSIDMYRKRSSQMENETHFDEMCENHTAISYLETDIDNDILNILKNLPPNYRDVFLLKYSSNLENKEIAQILNISEGTIRQRISRGKVIIQNELNKMEGK